MKFVENNIKNAWFIGLSFALTYILKSLLVYAIEVDLPNRYYDAGLFVFLYLVVSVSLKLWIDRKSKGSK